MPPSPIQMPSGTFSTDSSSSPSAAGHGPQLSVGSLPQSPGRSSFLPNFMRRPRAATGDSIYNPPQLSSDNLSSARQPQPLSSDSLLASNGPSSPQGTNRRRFIGGGGGNNGGLPSPPLSSSHRDDPLVNFGQRLIRRISNQGGSATSPSASQQTRGTPQRSSSTPPVSHGFQARPAAFGGNEVSYDESDERRGSVSAQAAAAPSAAVAPALAADVDPTSSSNAEASSSSPARPVHRLRLVPLLESSNSLPFDPVVRDVSESHDPTAPGAPDSNAHALRIGRFTDKQAGLDGTPRGGALTSNKVAFKSKVVSRTHAEIWVLEGGRFFVRDTKSSSGTFLNHQRLSPPSHESKPFALKDGDILQLGVDYQGGTEEIYKCVKMRAEIGRGWQTGANSFNTAAFKQLQALGGAPGSPATSLSKGKKVTKASVTDCCICLFSVTICQSLFIAPCSHVFHYKCIRPLLTQHHPGFSCPVCRSFADLEADVETEDVFDIASRRESLISRRGSLKSVKAVFDQGLADALGVTSTEGETSVQAVGEVSWDGGITPGLDLLNIGGDISPGGAAGGGGLSTRPDPSRQDTAVPGGSPFDDPSPAEQLRQSVQQTDEMNGSSSAAAHNPSSSSLTTDSPSSPAPAPTLVLPKSDSRPSPFGLPELPETSPLVVPSSLANEGGRSSSSSDGENTSSTSPEANKPASLDVDDGREGQGSSTLSNGQPQQVPSVASQ